ncbi:MAG: DUF624 domain-containing protein [Lachnospiraceae bacterium]|nr:DUF624 domain-containing protein [Lachnospiraceae bacterium]
MLEKIFDQDNGFMRVMETACDLILLNMLTLCFCIPVVTSGAALTALNDVVWHRIRNEETYIVKGFIRSFRANLKKGIAFGVFLLLVAGIFAVDYLAAGEWFPVLRVLVIVAAVCMLGIVVYVFALLSRYENTLANTVKNAALLAVGYFPRTVLMVAVILLYVAGMFCFLRYTVPVILLFGVSLPCYLCGLVYNGVFEAMDSRSEGKKHHYSI